MSPEQGKGRFSTARRVVDALKQPGGDPGSPQSPGSGPGDIQRRSVEIVPPGEGEDVFSIQLPFVDEPIPMYTSGLGRQIFRLGASVVPLSVETLRAVRDHAVQLAALRDHRPYETRMLEDGYGIQFVLPVTQIGGAEWPGVRARIGEVVDDVSQGKLRAIFSLKRRMVPGKREGKDLEVPIARGGEGKGGVRDLSKRVTRPTRQKMMGIIMGGTPLAVMNIETDTLDVQRLQLVNGDKRADEATTFFPTMHLMTQIVWIDKTRGLATEKTDFPLGQMPLRFNEQGELDNAPYYVQGPGGKKVYYHPALLGLRDTAAIISANICRRTRWIATVSEDSIAHALVKASQAGGHMQEVMKPHMERMFAIDHIESQLAHDPGMVLRVLPSVFRFVDEHGDLHIESGDILREVAVEVLGGPDSSGKPLVTTWTQLVQTVDRASQKHNANMTWEGDMTLAEGLLASAGGLQEIISLYEKLIGEKRGEEFDPTKQTPVPPIVLMADGYAPINLMIAMKAMWLKRHLHGHLARQAHQRQVIAAETFSNVSSVYTGQVEQFYRNMENGFNEQATKLGPLGTTVGTMAGKKAVQMFSKTDPIDPEAARKEQSGQNPKPTIARGNIPLTSRLSGRTQPPNGGADSQKKS